MNEYQIALMQENTDNIKNITVLGSQNVPSTVREIAIIDGDPKLKKQAIWEETTGLYKPYFPQVTPLSYEYFLKMRLAYGIADEFDFIPSLISTPKAISSTASAFRKNLVDADLDSEEGVGSLTENIVKTFLQGFQNQNAETLTGISKQDPHGAGLQLVPRIGACNYCKRASSDFDLSNFKTPTFHKNCGCGKLPIWK